MGKLGWNSGYIGSDQRDTAVGAVGYSKYYLERLDGRFLPVLDFSEGLLDLYPNAAAAYSLRRLSITYNSSAIRVRRSSDNTEQNIGFIGNDLNTTSLLSFVGDGDGFVTTWYDQSGNGRNATQSNAVNQPQIVSSGNVILNNNKPTVSFTDANKRMQTIDNNLSVEDCTISYVCRYISNPSFAAGGFGYGNHPIQSKSRYLMPLNNNLSFVTFGSDYISTIPASGDTSINLYSANYVMSTNIATVFKNNNNQSGTPGTPGTTILNAKFSINSIADRNESATINFSEGIFYAFNNSLNLESIRNIQNQYYSIY